MTKSGYVWVFVFLTLLGICSLVAAQDVLVQSETVRPGTSVWMRGAAVELYEGDMKEGDNFLALIEDTDLEFDFKNRVTIVSLVPSIDTQVCEIQTKMLNNAEELHEDVDVVTISRDLPMAQSRFAREYEMDNIRFVSDYKTGAFGKKSGLMMKGKELLARAILVLDEEGVILHIQVVPEVSRLPDVNRAIAVANQLVRD